jgi:hypothetical protein
MQRAFLREVSAKNGHQPVEDGVELDVLFNPQSLRLNHRSYGPRGSTRRTAKSKDGQAAGRSHQVTAYTSSLSMELFFDTTHNGKNVQNEKTLKLAKLLQSPGKEEAPYVEVSWGTFLFVGVIDTMDETLEYFSEEGIPLRARVSLRMSSKGLEEYEEQQSGRGGRPSRGEQPVTLSQEGDTVQSIASRTGKNWKEVARANNIDNPRKLQPGTPLSVNGGR